MRFKTIEDVNRHAEAAVQQAIADGSDECEARKAAKQTKNQIIASQPWLQPGGDIDVARALQAEGKAFKVHKNSEERDKWIAEVKARSPEALARAQRAREEEMRARHADPNHPSNPKRIAKIVDARKALLKDRQDYRIKAHESRHKMGAPPTQPTPPAPQTPEQRLAHRRWDDLGQHFENTERQIRRQRDDIRRNPDMMRVFEEESTKCRQEAMNILGPEPDSDPSPDVIAMVRRGIISFVAILLVTRNPQNAVRGAGSQSLAEVMNSIWDGMRFDMPWSDIEHYTSQCLAEKGFDVTRNNIP